MSHQRFTRERSGPPGARETRWTWLLLIPLPGPGWLVTAAGVFMLALEFDTAERLLERILERLEQVTDSAQRAGPWAKALVAALAVAGTAGAIAAVLLWDVPLLPV